MSLHVALLAIIASMLMYSVNSRWLMLPLILTNAWIFVLILTSRFLLRYSINRKASLQRQTLSHVVDNNKKEYGPKNKPSPKIDGEEWEHIGKTATPDVVPNTTYTGYIGFFHPFALVSFSQIDHL